MTIFLYESLKEKAIDAIRVMISKGSDKEFLPEALGFFVSVKRQRLCLASLEVEGRQYFLCQKIN